MCKYCNGNEAIFWKNNENHAVIDSKGEILVTVQNQTIHFQINRCPMCGRLFKGANYANLRQGDDIWYANSAEQIVEHGIISSIYFIKNNKVDSFSVDFDCGDFDEFDGTALGKSFFMNQVDAEEVLIHK